MQNVPETAGEVPPITVEEIRNQLAKMKGNKACGPDLIPIEVWKTMGEQGIVFLEKVLNEAITSGVPSSWRLSELTPLFIKGKGSILECSNYRGIKLPSHTLKLLERIIDQRLRNIVDLGNIQFGFRRGRSTMDPVFALKILQEKYREAKRFAHGIRRSGKSLRQSSQRFDMVGHEKEISPRRVREGDTGHVQRN